MVIKVDANYTKVLDDVARANGLFPVSLKGLHARYAKAKLVEDIPDGRKQKVTISVHCECAVAIRMLHEYSLLDASHDGNVPKPNHSVGSAGNTEEQQLSPPAATAKGPIKVGCSKRTCRLCQQYIAKCVE